MFITQLGGQPLQLLGVDPFLKFIPQLPGRAMAAIHQAWQAWGLDLTFSDPTGTHSFSGYSWSLDCPGQAITLEVGSRLQPAFVSG
jgi:hypothetical protein